MMPEPLSPSDHGLLYGAGFFETFRTCDGVPVRLDAHLARIRSACAVLGIRIPQTSFAHPDAHERRTWAIARLLRENDAVDGVVRFTLTAGEPLDGSYSSPREWLTYRPLPPEAPEAGITLHLLATRRDNGEWRPRPKSLNYLNSLVASRELAGRRRHPADEGLMTDAQGRVSEAVFANLFAIRGDLVVTPHEDTGCLPGVGRAGLIGALTAAGVTVKEVLETPEVFLASDALVTAGSVRGVVPVARVSDARGVTIREYATGSAARLVAAFR